jgi:hypothetical protein
VKESLATWSRRRSWTIWLVLVDYELIQNKLTKRKRKILLFPITVEEKLGHMEWKEVLYELLSFQW